MLDEKQLITDCVNEKREAQRILYDRYSRRLMAICLRYCRTRAEAEDVLQETFLKIFASLRTFRFESKLETWMTRITINTALNFQRQRLYLLPMVDVTEIQLMEDENVSLADFHFSELIKIVQALPDGCRIVFNLFAIEGYVHSEIASMLNISEGTSKSQLFRARTLLREKIDQASMKYEEGKNI
ncbi:MAG: sigma-70 family RNA polymerase sigma factor [Bacteroidetes bacterium]|nr:sigma-70 family RNA polymerase sigma factor [Bacteroidota bacterium]MBS1541048.1 sigma-70 family RNA polymerase sigma factor [Bacteroidota bacterium]